VSTHAAAVERAARPARPRSVLDGGGLLSVAMGVSGVLTYLFHVLAARSLGPHGYGQIAILWGAIFVAAIVLFRPLEQTVSRAIADRLARGDEVLSVLRSVLLIALAVLAVTIGAFAAGWSEINGRVFLGESALTAMLVCGIVAYGLAYVVRGVLGGLRWFGGYGVALVADASVRLLVAAPLVFVASQGIAAAALVAAGLGGAIVPVLFGRRLLKPLLRAGTGPRFQASSVLTFAGPATVVAAADQLLTNGAPLLVIVGNGRDASSAAGIVMAATLLVRAPVYVFQGVAAALLPNFTHLKATEGHTLRRAVMRTAGLLFISGGFIVALAGILGPAAMSIYGPEFEAGRGSLTLLGAGVAFYLAGSTFSQALLAIDHGRGAAKAWATSATLFVVVYAAVPGDELFRISLSFAAATLAGLLLLGSTLLRRTA
jgi:O-antigen/teichoic acid export membrane protein